MRSALSYPQFRRLLAALAVSQAGDWLYNVALLAVVYERTRSATWVAMTTVARVAPMVALGPLGGVIADRFDRRRTMVVSDFVRVACMLCLAGTAQAGLPILLAPVLAALSTMAGSPYPPCVAAATPSLVPAAHLPGANAARSAVGGVCIVAGPGLGALLLLVGSPWVALLVNAGTFAVSALLVLSLPAADLRAPRQNSAAPTGVWADVREGAAALRAEPQALRLIGADVMCSVVYGAHTVLLVLLARQLGAGDAGYGLLLAAMGLGGILGSAIASRVASARRQLPLVAAAIAVALPALVLAVTSWFPAALLLSAVIGGGSIVVEVCTETSLQRSLPADVLGRAYGIAFPAAIGGIAVGSLLAAPLAVAFGLTVALAIVGSLMAAYAVLLAVRAPSGGQPWAVDLESLAATS
jgi:MFS family permease